MIKGGVIMGLIDNVRKFLKNRENTQEQQPQVNEEYEKARLATEIVNLVHGIKRINSFDSSLWNLSNVSSYELKRKNLNELKSMKSSLENRFSELNRQKQKNSTSRESIEAAKWTGQRPRGISQIDLDRLQRSDDGR